MLSRGPSAASEAVCEPVFAHEIFVMLRIKKSAFLAAEPAVQGGTLRLLYLSKHLSCFRCLLPPARLEHVLGTSGFTILIKGSWWTFSTAQKASSGRIRRTSSSLSTQLTSALSHKAILSSTMLHSCSTMACLLRMESTTLFTPSRTLSRS